MSKPVDSPCTAAPFKILQRGNRTSHHVLGVSCGQAGGICGPTRGGWLRRASQAEHKQHNAVVARVYCGKRWHLRTK